MKKRLLSFGIFASLLFAQFVTPVVLPANAATVQAASEVNFDQGSMSDEEYVKNIVDQLLAQDAIAMEINNLSNDDIAPSSSIVDFKNKAQSIITEEGGQVSETYAYNDGSFAKRISSEIEMLKAINFDNEAAIDELASELKGKYVVNKIDELAGSIDLVVESYGDYLESMTSYENQDGKVVASSDVNPIQDLSNLNPAYSMYPEGSSIQNKFIVDPEAGTLTIETIIDVNEDAVEEESGDELGLSLSDLLTDSQLQVVISPTTETVPALEDLDTITKEEFKAKAEEKGLTVY